MSDLEILQANLQRILKAKSMQKADLAKILEVTPSTVSNNLFAKDSDPRLSTLSKVAQSLNVSLSELLTDVKTIEALENKDKLIAQYASEVQSLKEEVKKLQEKSI